MSKLLRANLPAASVPVLILQLFNNSPAQDISARIALDINAKEVVVDGKFCETDDSRLPHHLAFLKDYAEIGSLGDRITGLELTSGDSRKIPFRQMIPGEFLAEGAFRNWHYAASLEPRKDPTAAAHVSWIGDDLALIFLDDLLPQISGKDRLADADIQFDLPKDWHVYTGKKNTGGQPFHVTNVQTAVFLLGKDIRSQSFTTGAGTTDLFITGNWQFSDDEAAGMVKEIYENYCEAFGSGVNLNTAVALLKFPVITESGRWEGDTRGSTVNIISTDMPFKTQALQRLHEQLRHEIFHLWIPNGIRLTGKYDWFYEGFALYFSLKSGVLLGRIRFDDLLDTLSRAFTIDTAQNPRMSLIEASRVRWSGGNTTVYARGMIIAFLCDIALLNRSRGKANVSDILRELFNKYRNETISVDGTEAVLNILGSHTELVPIIDKYIKGNARIDWTADLQNAGILSHERDLVTELRTVEKPGGRQKAILDRLGYNKWRKIGIPSR